MKKAEAGCRVTSKGTSKGRKGIWLEKSITGSKNSRDKVLGRNE